MSLNWIQAAIASGFKLDSCVDGDVVPGGLLLSHDSPAAQMCFDVGIVGRHHRYDVLVQPRCGLGAEITRHAVALVRSIGGQDCLWCQTDPTISGQQSLRGTNLGSENLRKEYVTLK